MAWLPTLLAIGLVPATALAQQTASMAPKWEVEVYTGDALVSHPRAGTPTATPPGTPFTTSSLRTSRSISSWYFGDGATLFNQLNTAFFTGASVAPLDPVLSARLARPTSGRTFGVRGTRRLTPRFAAEVSFEYGLGRTELTDEARAAIEATRSSFVTAWNGVIRTGPFFNPVVTSNATLTEEGGRQMVATGALNIGLGSFRGLAPYATVGAGVTSTGSKSPGVVLAGNYQFSLFGITPMNERDTVTVRAVQPDTLFTGVLGGGFKYAVSRRWGLRLDVRDHLTRNRLDTIISAEPSVTMAPAGGTFIASFTTPSVQFSNTTNQRSTLSGPALTNFRTFEGSGLQHRVAITAGVFWRF